jgi:hypothetical protein
MLGNFSEEALQAFAEAKNGLYANIHKKQKRIAAGSGEKMAGKNDPDRPTAGDFKAAAKTAKKQ